MAGKASGEERQLGGELVIPALAVIFTLYYFSTIWNSPWTAQVSAFLIGGILLAFCVMFFLRVAAVFRAGEGALGFANLVNREDLRTGRVWLFLATLGYCYFIDVAGFTLTTFLFLAISMLALAKGRNAGRIAGLSALMAFGGWAVFIFAFDTRFPRGIFENLMASVLG